MTTDIRPDFDARDFIRRWGRDVIKQIPFATALALTWTAKDAQGDVRRRLPETFTLRSNWIPRGVTIKPATKTDLTAAVGHQSDFMLQHAEGGDRIAKSGKLLGVPLVPARPNRTDKTPRKVWPGAFKRRRRDKAWVQKWGPIQALVRRKSKTELEPIYLLMSTIKIKKTWPLREQTADVVRARIQANWNKAMERAWRSRRP